MDHDSILSSIFLVIKRLTFYNLETLLILVGEADSAIKRNSCTSEKNKNRTLALVVVTFVKNWILLNHFEF